MYRTVRPCRTPPHWCHIARTADLDPPRKRITTLLGVRQSSSELASGPAILGMSLIFSPTPSVIADDIYPNVRHMLVPFVSSVLCLRCAQCISSATSRARARLEPAGTPLSPRTSSRTHPWAKTNSWVWHRQLWMAPLLITPGWVSSPARRCWKWKHRNIFRTSPR